MLKKQWSAPLLAMTASIIMCTLLSVCKTSHASSYSSQVYSNTESQSITIKGTNGKVTYHVNGKTFTYARLSAAQKNEISEVEEKLEKLEAAIDIESDKMEQWSEKVEAVAEKMEDEADRFEDSIDNLELDDHSLKLSKATQKLELVTKNMELKMRVLESKMKAIEENMPEIDKVKLQAIEEQSEKYRILLLEISETI